MARLGFSNVQTEEDNRNLVDIFTKNPLATIQELEAIRTSAVPELESLISHITTLTRLKSELSLKNSATALAKIQRPEVRTGKPWLQLAHLRDLLRFRTHLREIDDFVRVFSIFEDEVRAKRLEFVKVDCKKLTQPKEFGWRMIATDLRLPSGMLVEHYMTFGDMIIQNDEWLHKIFEKWRGKTSRTLGDHRARYRDAALSYAANRDAFVRLSSLSLTNRYSLDSTMKVWRRDFDAAVLRRLGL